MGLRRARSIVGCFAAYAVIVVVLACLTGARAETQVTPSFGEITFSSWWLWTILAGVVVLLVGIDLRMQRVAEQRAETAKAEMGVALAKVDLDLQTHKVLPYHQGSKMMVDELSLDMERRTARAEGLQEQRNHALDVKIDKILELLHKTREELMVLKAQSPPEARNLEKD